MSKLNNFIDFLANQWSASPDRLHNAAIPDIQNVIAQAKAPIGCEYRPWHWYPITTNACWRQWKIGGKDTCSLELESPARNSFWWCASLKEAAQHYSWSASQHGTFISLSEEIRTAIKASNTQAVASLCHRILDWGGVGRAATNASRVWINQQESAGSLIDALECAVKYLQPQSPKMSRFDFDGVDIPMNSATTKLFAAADPTNATLIFDGRVGAALCLLVRRFLEIGDAETKISEDLLFYWGPHATKPEMRNPSTHQFIFRNINQVTNLARAQASQRANIIADRLYAKADVPPDSLERALFMLGYSVKNDFASGAIRNV